MVDDEAFRPEELRIGLFGWFNPHIFTQAWLEREALLDPESAGTSPEFFESETLIAAALGGMHLEVSYDRFVVSTDWVGGEVAKRFVTEVFRRLRHTPVDGVVISWAWQVDAGPDEDCTLLRLVAGDAATLIPRTMDELSVGAPRTDGLIGRQRLQVETDDDDQHRLIDITFVDEIQVSKGEELPTTDEAMELFDKLWVTSQEDAHTWRTSLDEVFKERAK